MRRHIMKSRAKVLITFLIISLFSFGCGGSGGGGGDGGIGGEDRYGDGIRTPVTITEENAQKVGVESMMMGVSFSNMGEIALSVAPVPDESGIVPIISYLNELIEKTFQKRQGLVGQDIPMMSVEAAATLSETENGDCGGSVTVTYNDSTKTSGVVVYHNYCTNGVTVSGSASFSIVADATSDHGTMDITYNELKFTAGSYTETVDGTVNLVSVSNNSTPPKTYTNTYTYNIFVTDEGSSKTFWFSDYILRKIETSRVLYYALNISGRFYDPDQGYVDLQTTSDFSYQGQTYPSSGVLIANGSNGTMARLTALSSMTYKVEADTNNDETYEWDSGVKYWSEWDS
jgi:hypothetical protein